MPMIWNHADSRACLMPSRGEFSDAVVKSLQDPITQALIENPVVAPDGLTYSRESLEEWLQRQQQGTSPSTRLPMSIDSLRPNIQVQQILDLLQEKKKKKLFASIQHNNFEDFKSLLEKFDFHKETKNKALLAAASQDKLDMVNILLQNDTDVDAVDDQKRTSLYIASTKNYDKVVHVLLQNKANINLAKETGDTPLHVSCLKNYNKIVYLL